VTAPDRSRHARSELRQTDARPKNASDGVSWGAGTQYTYPLSKRTAVYAAYSYFSNNNNSPSLAKHNRHAGNRRCHGESNYALGTGITCTASDCQSVRRINGRLAPVFSPPEAGTSRPKKHRALASQAGILYNPRLSTQAPVFHREKHPWPIAHKLASVPAKPSSNAPTTPACARACGPPSSACKRPFWLATKRRRRAFTRSRYR
jgi:hypothetical protein